MRNKELRNRECSKKIAHRYIVNFIDGVSEKEQNKIVKQFGGRVLKKFRTPAFDRFAVVHIDDAQVEQLLAHKLVESIDQDIEAGSPSSNEVETWGHATAQLYNFWNAGYTGAGVKVAIIDTGVSPHPDLPTPLSTWNVVTDSTDVTDVNPSNHGHGTCSAGIIAARSNGSFVKGVAFDSNIHVINCYFQKAGDTQRSYTNISYTTDALQYAATLDVDVVLCNVQLIAGSASMQAACDILEAKGVPILAAAGNFADQNGDITKDTVYYPGHYEKVVAVGAVQKSSSFPYLKRASYSGTGPYLNIASFTDLETTSKSGGYSYSYSGTSCATPFATGVMALLKQAYPNYSAQQLRDKLYEGATPFGTKNEYGVGLIGLPISLLPSNKMPSFPLLSASTTEDFSDSNFNFNLIGDFVIGTDNGRTVLRTPAYSNTGTGISRFTFQVPVNAVNPQISVTHRSDCRSTDIMLVTVNGMPMTYASNIESNYKTDTLALKPGGKYLVELRWDKYESYSAGSNAVFIDSISVNFTTSGSGGGTPGDSITNPIVVSGTSANGTLLDTKDVYFKYIVPTTGSYTFTTSASFDAYMQLLDSSQNLLAQDDDSAGNAQPKITYTLSTGQVVYLKVYGYNHGAGKNGPITLNITPASVGSVPGTPSVSVGSPTTSSLTINMSATGATSFNVYRSTSASGTYSLIASGVTSPYMNTGLSSNTTYYYKVAGVNNYGTGAQSTYAYGTTSNSGGGVTPTTIVEDFSDSSFDPRLNLSLSGWEYDPSVGSIMAIVADSTASATLSVDIPSGAATRTLKFDYKGMIMGGSSGINYTQVFVNGVLKHTLTDSDVQWRTQTINLGTGYQAIEIRASSSSSNTWTAVIDNIIVSWK